MQMGYGNTLCYHQPDPTLQPAMPTAAPNPSGKGKMQGIVPGEGQRTSVRVTFIIDHARL